VAEEVAGLARVRPVLEVGTGAEVLADPGEDRNPDVGALGDFVEGFDEAATRLAIERIDRRLVQADDRDIFGNFKADAHCALLARLERDEGPASPCDAFRWAACKRRSP